MGEESGSEEVRSAANKDSSGTVKTEGGSYVREDPLMSAGAECVSPPGTSALPLRLRQLPASFWKEPNRPKTEYYPLPAVSLAYLGQSYKTYQPIYKDLSSPDMSGGYNHRAMSLSLGTWPAGRGEAGSVPDYLYRNYAAKYQNSKLPDLSWGCLRFPEAGQKLPARPLTGLSSNPYGLSPHRRTYGSSDFSGYPVVGAGAPSGLWDGFSLGQYPNHSVQDNLPPWRPVPAKSGSSYPSRYHPFAV